MDYAWFIWSLILLAIWFGLYGFLRDREERREMLVVSLWTSLLGLTEPLFVPEYWSPPSLFGLARATGFDLESIIFSFAIGGIATALYEWIFRSRHAPMSPSAHHASRHRFHGWALSAAPILFILLLLFTPLNPIYAAILALTAGGFATWYCRPDLKRKMSLSALLFALLYFFYFLTLDALYPGYVQAVWNLSALSGILFIGIPLEEILFAASFGFLWSSVYEHFTWRRIKN